MEIEEIFKCANKFKWESDICNEEIIKISKKVFPKISAGCSKQKICFRIIGQSGSGKTTQLLPACKKWFEKENLNPLHLCVRRFAEFYPNYNKLKTLEKGQIRERTNGFALRLLIVCLFHAIKSGIDIIFEMTLLTPEFEKIANSWLCECGYKTTFFANSVSKKISDKLIQEREVKKGKEKGRKVEISSSTFFYKNLKKSLIFLRERSPSERIVIFNLFQCNPVYDGPLCRCIKPFSISQQINDVVMDEKDLKKAKTRYMLKVFKAK